MPLIGWLAVLMSTHACFKRHKEVAQQHEERAHALVEDTSAILGGRSPAPAPAIVAATDALGGCEGGSAGVGTAAVAATAAQATVQSDMDVGGGGVTRTPTKLVRLAIHQQRLAVREYREATRLRPRDVETRKQLQAAQAVLQTLQAALSTPKPHPLRQFLAHYNLSIRYWDLGKSREALVEAKSACEELCKAGLRLGCAEHNLFLMTKINAEFRKTEQRLLDATKRAPEAVNPNYSLGVLYFDKRMLLRAESQLKLTRDRARHASALQLVEHNRHHGANLDKNTLWREEYMLDRVEAQLNSAQDPVKAASVLHLGNRNLKDSDGLALSAIESKKARRITNLLERIEDDLDFIAGLRECWCVEEEAGKVEGLQATGIRDGARPHLLPCLHRRYAQDSPACDQWWSEICKCTDIDLCASPP